MTVYKIDGTASHDADVHLIQDGSYLGYKSVNSGNYEISFDSTTPSGLIAVAKKLDGEVFGYGGVVGITSSGTSNIVSPSNNVVIKSIQIVPHTRISDRSIVKDYTISDVDTSKTILMNVGSYGNNADPHEGMIRAELINSTTVRLTRNAYQDPGDVHYYFTVVEYSSGIKSIQRGASGIGTITISEVNVNKTIVNICNASSTAGSFEDWRYGNMTNNRGYLNSSIEIELFGHNSNTISYEVIEFE